MKIIDYELTKEERETHICIIKNENGQEIAEVETTENPCFNMLSKKGWALTNEIRNKRGCLIQANFEAPAWCVSFRSVSKPRTKSKPSTV